MKPAVKIIQGDGPVSESTVMVLGIEPVLSAQLADRAQLEDLAAILKETDNYREYLEVDRLLWEHHLRPGARVQVLGLIDGDREYAEELASGLFRNREFMTELGVSEASTEAPDWDQSGAWSMLVCFLLGVLVSVVVVIEAWRFFQ